MLDGDAAVHGHRDPRRLQPGRGVRVDDPLLHEEEADAPPRSPGPPPEPTSDDRRKTSTMSMDTSARDLGEAPVARLAQDLPVARIDRHDPVTALLEVPRDHVGRTGGIRGAARRPRPCAPSRAPAGSRPDRSMVAPLRRPPSLSGTHVVEKGYGHALRGSNLANQILRQGPERRRRRRSPGAPRSRTGGFRSPKGSSRPRRVRPDG